MVVGDGWRSKTEVTQLVGRHTGYLASTQVLVSMQLPSPVSLSFFQPLAHRTSPFGPPTNESADTQIMLMPDLYGGFSLLGPFRRPTERFASERRAHSGVVRVESSSGARMSRGEVLPPSKHRGGDLLV